MKTLEFEKASFYLYIYENKITGPLLKKYFYFIACLLNN